MNNRQLEELFPAFMEIKDEALREQSMEAMRLAMKKGGWTEETIMKCPVTLNWYECDVSWVEHVTDVTKMCLMEYDALAKYYSRHGVEFSRDVVAAGALIHDIGKLTEFVMKDGEVAHGDDYELMRHPLSGALLASQAGLSSKIVHLIATHSFEGERSYQTPESEFVRAIDIFVFNCSVKGLAKK